MSGRLCLAVTTLKTLLGVGGALAAPSTAYIYDWNILPIGQALWLKELESPQTTTRGCQAVLSSPQGAALLRMRINLFVAGAV